jgi:hypothetical protein
MESNSERIPNEQSLDDDFSSSKDVAKRYAAVFPVEVECWCYGLTNFPGQLYPKLVHRVIKEMAPIFRSAIESSFVFELIETAKKISDCSNQVVTERQAVFAILANLPQPYDLDEDSLMTLGQVVDQAEQAYGGVLEQMEELWKRENQRR